ncbi:MAG: hypothetical protein FWH26_11470 [Oscillospiraceae bacterium]|nr:hypothetical protein [Oscillospiraceae bacterium]
MKRNAFLRLALGLLVISIACSSLFMASPTAAKYVAAGEADGPARVAIFSFLAGSFKASEAGLFGGFNTTPGLDGVVPGEWDQIALYPGQVTSFEVPAFSYEYLTPNATIGGPEGWPKQMTLAEYLAAGNSGNFDDHEYDPFLRQSPYDIYLRNGQKNPNQDFYWRSWGLYDWWFNGWTGGWRWSQAVEYSTKPFTTVLGKKLNAGDPFTTAERRIVAAPGIGPTFGRAANNPNISEFFYNADGTPVANQEWSDVNEAGYASLKLKNESEVVVRFRVSVDTSGTFVGNRDVDIVVSDLHNPAWWVFTKHGAPPSNPIVLTCSAQESNETPNKFFATKSAQLYDPADDSNQWVYLMPGEEYILRYGVIFPFIDKSSWTQEDNIHSNNLNAWASLRPGYNANRVSDQQHSLLGYDAQEPEDRDPNGTGGYGTSLNPNLTPNPSDADIRLALKLEVEQVD